MMKQYLLNLLHQCSEHNFGQNAIEWAIVSGRVRLSYERDADIREIMSRYDEIIEAYRRSEAKQNAAPPTAHAPMKRAVPGRRSRSGSASESSTGRKRAA